MLKHGVVVLLTIMASSVSGGNLLVNPSFDDPTFEVITCHETNRDAVPGWYRLEVVDNVLQRSGPLDLRNGLHYSPDCPRDPEGDNDSIHATIMTYDMEYREGIEQTVSGISPGATLTFSGWWSIGNGRSDLTPPGTDAYAYAELHDGPDGHGVPVDSAMIVAPPNDPMSNWLPFSISAEIYSGQVTVRVRILTGLGLGQKFGFHLDGCELRASVTCHTPFADADGDGDVDAVDFAVLQRCLTGDEEGHPPIPANPTYCTCFDRAGTVGAIDAADVEAFLNCMTGPMIPHATHPNPNCVDGP